MDEKSDNNELQIVELQIEGHKITLHFPTEPQDSNSFEGVKRTLLGGMKIIGK